MVPSPAFLLALVLLASPAIASAADPSGPSPREACRAAIAEHFQRQHMDLARIDRNAVCDEFVKKAAAGFASQYLSRWLTEEMLKIEFDYAPVGARHAPGVRYRWPFEAWIPRLVTQASAGPTHSAPEERFAIDFLMPIGSAVLAARAGRVVEVRDGTPAGASWTKDGGNAVVILHEDGTFAFYGHLQKGIPVELSQEVEAGDRIAASGNTGFSFTPHLHFVVRRAETPGRIRAVPVRFGERAGRGIFPQPNRHWGTIPRTRRELRVSVGGQAVSKDEPQSFPYGAEVELEVELLDAEGGATDVTTSERTRYETMTLWNLHSPERGRVRLAAVPGIDAKYMERAMSLLNKSRAQLFVYHGEPKDIDFAVSQVTFEISVAAPAE